MTIVNLEQFLKFPAGTVYTRYEPCVFGSLEIKGESVEETGDFFFSQVVGSFGQSDSDFLNLCQAAENGENVEFDFRILLRDGLFNPNQLFAVWLDRDVAGLIGLLAKGGKP